MKGSYLDLYKIAFFLLFIGLAACTNDDISEIVDPNPSIENEMPGGVEELVTAYKEGKTISNILFIPGSSSASDLGSRWLITFTDGNSLNLFNHPEHLTPYMRVNNEGFWSIANDGKTFDNIKDNDGNDLYALTREIDLENPLQAEVDILCVQPNLNNRGFLNIETYIYPDTQYLLETIETLESLPDDIGIVGIVQNDFTGRISFYIKGMEPIHFSYKNRWPYSFGILNSDEMVFKEQGDSASIEFFISPSDLDFKLDSDTPLLDLRLVYLNGQEAINYSTYPVEIKEISKVTDEKGERIPGRYKAVLEDVGDNLFTYNEPVTLSVNYLGVERETLTLSSPVFYAKYDSESPLIIDSPVPVIKIKSPSLITSKDIWTEDCEIEFLNAGKYDKSYSKVQIKGRGNSTWELPKKPYAIKLDKKDEMLGFPKHKRWVLLANYYDKTNLRNEISFYLGRMSEKQAEKGLGYTPRTSFVRFFFNEKFQGLYQFTEQLKIDDNRVDVGDDGFLLEIDFRALEEPDNIYFRIPHIDNYIVVKDPDIENQSDLEYIKDFMKKADEALFAGNFKDPQEGYKRYIDINSFVDWYLVNEITKNADSNYWTSCYMNLSRGGKLRMGPLWDYDLAAGNYKDFGDWWYTQWINDPKDFHIKNVPWYSRMFQDPEFVKVLKQHFQFYYDRQNEIYKEIENQKNLISPLIEENEKIWFQFSKPYDKTVSASAFNAGCDELKSWLQQRFDWLKREFEKL